MSIALGRIVDRLRREGLLTGGEPPPSDATVDRITTDSRFVTPGTLFCAVRGSVLDSHAFLPAAAAAGAVAALVEVPDPRQPIPQVTVTSGRRAAAFAAAELYGDPWAKTTLLGVTGTNGKTTTVWILRHLLARRGPAASLGTLGLVGPDGATVPGTEALTTPGPAQLAELVHGLVQQGVTGIAMEVSSHALDQDRVSAATYTGAVFTNLSRDHLDYHGSLETYRAAKLKLLDLVRPGGVVALNQDDPSWAAVAREGIHLVRYGMQGRGEVQADAVEMTPEGIVWHLHTPSCTAPIRLPLFGTYNLYNALGAAAVLWGLGWTAEEIASGLADLPQVPGRLERVDVPDRTVLIDYAHTPDALERALVALRPLTPGRLVVVFGAGGNRDRGKRPEMGRVAARLADLAIVTTDNPRHEAPEAIADDIEQGMGDVPRTRILDRRAAIAHALESVGEGDVVLLAGKGHERYQIWGDEHRPFDERTVVREILEKGVRN